MLDKLRSLLATYRYRNNINAYKTDGIDFSTYIFVPEFDQNSGEYFHEKEDHCHMLKRIWKHKREGGPEGFNLQGLDDAMMDSSTWLTHAALTGERKQSVTDAERMLSFLVGKFLLQHGYVLESNSLKQLLVGTRQQIVEVSASWKVAKQNIYKMLNLILDEWMSWHVVK
jgi:hypothetical protein